MQNALRIAILLLSAAETLILHWGLIAGAGRGLSALEALVAGIAFAAVNAVILPFVRSRIRSRGLTLAFTRTWILGSVAAFLSGLMLTAVFAGVTAVAWLAGVQATPERVLVGLGGLAVLTGFGGVLWAYAVGQRRVVVENVTLPVASAEAPGPGLRIAHISDLHIGPLMEPPLLRRLVDRVNDVGADLVAITGDIFDFDPAYVPAGCRELARLSAPHGVYAILGNHDVYTGADYVAAELARETGMRVLRDEWVSLEVGEARLSLVGIEDTGIGWQDRECESPELEVLACELPEESLRVLLAHRPGYLRQAARLGFHAALAGHTHGGQVAAPVAKHWNASRAIAHWTRGTFVEGTTALYVNRGLGVAGLPLRLNCPREIALIELSEATP